MPLIVVDAGHGGSDPGASSNGLVEKEITLVLARYTRDALLRSGFHVLLTRERDSLLLPNGTVEQDLHARAEVANTHNADYFLSWHLDSFSGPSVHGVTGYIYTKSVGTKTEADAQTVLSSIIASTGAVGRGIRPANFAVVRETRMPAVLVEAGFLTSPEEAAMMKRDNYLHLIAEGAAKGIARIFGATYLPPVALTIGAPVTSPRAAVPESTSPASPAPSPGPDAQPSPWAAQAVRLVQQWGVMKGYPDGQFHPHDGMTREMVAQTIVNLVRFLEVHGGNIQLPPQAT